MESQGRGSNPALSERARRESRRFEFAQLAVLLRRLHGDGPARGFRYRGDFSMRYPAAESEIRSMPETGPDRPGEIAVSFLGLAGLMGALPPHYAELLEQRSRTGDPTLARFLSIFENRATSLFLHAHLRYRPWLRLAWSLTGPFDETRPPHDTISEMLLALVGTSASDLRRRAGIPVGAQVHFAGLLGQQPRTADALRNVLEDYFGATVHVEQFRGSWVPIPEGAVSRIGARRGATLGRDLVAGARYFDPSAAARIDLGPLSRAQFEGLLPGTPGSATLHEFLHFALGHGISFDFTLTLRADDVPPARLSCEPVAPQRLGWSFWLQSGDEKRNAVAGPFTSRASDIDRNSGR